MRSLPRALTFAGILLCAVSQAQFQPPAPLAWRWWQQTNILPNGTPLVDGQTIYLASGPRVYSLNAETGNQKWRFPAAVPNAGGFHEMPVLVDGVLIEVSDANYAYGLDPQTGLEKLKHYMAKGVVGKPAAAGKFVAFALSDNTIVALNAQTGEEAWKDGPLKIQENLSGPLASHEGNVLFFDGANQLESLDVAARKIDWKRPFTFVEAKTRPIVYGDTVYVNSGSFLSALNASTGRGLWQKDVGEQLAYEPGVGPKSIMVVTRNGFVMAFDENGNKMSRNPKDIGTTPIAGPASVGDSFLVASGNGSLNLVDPRTTTSTWSFVMRPINKGWAKALNASTGRSNPTLSGSATIDFVTAAGPATTAGNTLLVLARDGSLLAFDKANGVDLTGPELKMVKPNPGDQVSGQPGLMIAFTVQDEASGVNETSVKIELDGKPVEFEKTKEHYYVLTVTEFGKLRPLSDGHHTFTLTASDWMGNESKKSFSLTVDNTLRPPRPLVQPGLPGGIGGGGGGGGGGRGGGGG